MIQAHDFGQGHIGMKEDHANQAVLAECVAKGAPLTRKAMTVQGLAVRSSAGFTHANLTRPRETGSDIPEWPPSSAPP